MREAACEISRLGNEFGRVAGSDLRHPRRRRDRHHRHDPPPPGASREDRARHGSGRSTAKSITSQPDVGRQYDNRFRITVHESRLAPNIGLEELWSLHTPE